MLETRIAIGRETHKYWTPARRWGLRMRTLKGSRFQKLVPFFCDMDAYPNFWCAYPEILELL